MPAVNSSRDLGPRIGTGQEAGVAEAHVAVLPVRQLGAPIADPKALRSSDSVTPTRDMSDSRSAPVAEGSSGPVGKSPGPEG